MAERPILFSGPLVRAILNGHKTQTRRVIRPQPGTLPQADYVDGHWWAEDRYGESRRLTDNCPYGQPGDLLYVRETWAHESSNPCEDAPNCGLLFHIWYRANHPHGGGPDRWRPSIHMPKWAARLWLRVTDVRVERLQDINEADALAEGVIGAGGASLGLHGPRHHFAHLWDSLNAARGYGWDRNPWVWVVEFNREHV